MELLPPKLRVLPPSDQLGAIVDGNKLWEIDSPSLEWSLGLAYLFSNVDEGNFENVLLKLFGFEEMPKMNHWILQAKNSIVKYNPFKNRNTIYSDRNMRVMLENIKTRLHAVIDSNEQEVLEEQLEEVLEQEQLQDVLEHEQLQEVLEQEQLPEVLEQEQLQEVLKEEQLQKVFEQLQEVLEEEQLQEILEEEQLQEVLNKKYVDLLETATKLFDCVILLYGVDPVVGECKFISMHNNSNISLNDSLKIVIFLRAIVPPSKESNSSPRFGFGLSLKYSKPLRHSAVVHFLKAAKLPEDKILQIEKARFFDNGLLKCLFEAGCEDIIPSIYRSPYLVFQISEAGFETDPCTLDDSGFSSFYYSMGLSKCDSLNILYSFVTNNSHLTDSSVRNPDSNILLALEKVENVIKNDCLSSNNFQLSNLRKDVALKRYQEIIFFNKYQRSICQHVYDLKKDILSMDRNKQVMVSILDTYRKYLYFDSILSVDDLKLFENFVRYSEYHENLDNFNCLLFFENVSALIPLKNKNNSSIFYDAISSLFLSVLSNDFFPKHKHEIECTGCELSLDDCEQNQNSRRFMPFKYRTCFSENAHSFVRILTVPASEQQEEPVASLLDILRQSLSNLSEIVDEFIITRLTSYLEVATRMPLHDSPIKRMLTMERALQVVGEVFGNDTICRSVIRTLLQSCIPEELVNKLCCMRDNTLSHYRKNAINGRLKIEKDKHSVDRIQEELSDVDDNFLPVYISQIFRVKEFLTKEGKTMSQNKFESIQCEMDTQLREFINKRKPLCGTQELNFEYLLFNLLKKLYQNLNIGNNTVSEDMRTDWEALIFLLNFITDHYSNNSSSELTTSANKLAEIVASFKDSNKVPDEIINKIKKLMKSHLKILETDFKCVQKSYMNANFPYILSLNDKIKNNKIFNAKGKRKIRRKVLECVNNSAYLMQILKKSLGKCTIIDDLNSILECVNNSAYVMLILKNSLGKCAIIDNLNSILECMILPEQKRSGLAQEIGKNTKTGYKKANKILSQVNEKENVDELCLFDENVDVLEPFTVREELMNMLLKIKFPKTIRKKVIRILNTKLWFLIDRIDRLKAILILEDESLRGLWKSKKWNATIEKQMKCLMVQRYMREKDLQSSLEMLLFDCMNILEKREDLKNLWLKTNDLFSGAKLIDVLAHGNPILQTVGTILSPEDLPSEFIEKILELIRDVDSMRALSEMWKKTKLCKSSKFLSVVESEDTGEYTVLRKRIKISSRWKEYSKLLPLVK